MQPITWIHTADLHLDMPVQGWRGSKEVLWQRQEEYRVTFQKIISLAKEKDVTFLIIAGDFLEHGFVTHSTLSFVSEQFARIPNTKVWIAPGNHDPYRSDSYYQIYKWPDHVYIFQSEWEQHDFSELDLTIYGKGFRDFVEPEPSLPSISNQMSRRILIAHGTYLTHHEKSPYFPIYRDELNPLQLDYVALGHIHKAATYSLANSKNTVIRYAGSPEALNWKELGVRTVTWGCIDDEGVKWSEIPIQTSRYERMEIEITGCKRKEEVLQEVKSSCQSLAKERSYVTCRFTGQKHEELGCEDHLFPWLNEQLKKEGFRHVYFEDETTPELDLPYYRRQAGLVGTFIKRMEKKIAEVDEESQPYLRRAMFQTVELLLRKKVTK